MIALHLIFVIGTAKAMKNTKSQKKHASVVSGTRNSSKTIEKHSKKKSKMHRKIFSKTKDGTSEVLIKGKVTPIEVAKPAAVTKEVIRAVANVKPPKDKVSSNWAAFKDNGLHLTQSKPKPKSKSEFKGLFRKKRKMLASGSTTELKESGDMERDPNDCIDIEDSYVRNLVAPDEKSLKGLTKCIAIDCEMVGVGDGKESALARVSLVNQHGVCLYDKFVKPKEDVADYRTKVSGVRPGDLALGEELETVQKDVAKIVEGRILVGHAISHDLKVLFLSHPPHMIRDTSKFRPFKDMFDGRIPALRKLAEKILGVKIQDGEHSSIEDAKATMQLYNLYQKEWEEHRKLKACE